MQFIRQFNDKGRALVAEMNRLGILVDITHGTEAAQKQITEASKMLGCQPSQPDHGEYIEMFNKAFGNAQRARRLEGEP